MSKKKSVGAASLHPFVHTPGPWEVRENQGLFAVAHRDGWVLESNDEQQDRADARLIAAAPDLLEALEAIIGEAGFEGLPEHKQHQIHAAIKKATN